MASLHCPRAAGSPARRNTRAASCTSHRPPCARREHRDTGHRFKLRQLSVDDAVVGLGTFLTEALVKHPTKRFALAAFEADSKEPVIFKDTGCRFFNFGFGRRIWKAFANRPCVDGCVRPLPTNLVN